MSCGVRRKNTSVLARSENVLIIDGDPVDRQLEAALLEACGHAVVGQANDGYEALAILGQCSESLILMDLDMPRGDGLALLPRIRRLSSASVLVVSLLNPDIYARRAMRLGAQGYLNKREGMVLLPEMIERLGKGQMLFPHRISDVDPRLDGLSDSEIVALRCLARGGGVEQVAMTLMMTSAAVGVVCRRIEAKLKVSSLGELCDCAQELQLN